MNLTEKQQRFADEFIISGNATQAYFIAYPTITKESTANAASSRLLRNVKVKAYIDERLAELKKKSIAEADEILQFLTSTMRGEIKEPVAVFVGEGVQEIEYLPPNVATRRQAGLDMLKRYDVLPKTQLEIEKLKKELEGGESNEDKLEGFLELLGDAIDET